jgi:hypothetical protein
MSSSRIRHKFKYRFRRSGRSGNSGSKIGGLLFGAMFFGMGALFCWIMGVSPLLQALDSREWAETACIIDSSAVKRHHSSDGTTYSVAISYTYQVQGRHYQSDRYNFSSASSSGHRSKAAVVARYPVGSEQVCWFDPEDPSRAVLSRDIPSIVYFIFPFTSIFMLIGLIALLGTAGLLPKRWALPFNNQHQRVSSERTGRQKLKPSSTGIGKVFFVTFIACFWNGIVSVFMLQVIKSHQSGHPDWFLTLFMTPFVVVGIVLVFAILHSLLALANPKLELTLGESSPALGDRVQLDWSSSKPLRRVRHLKISLQGIEAATYRRGTRSTTDRATFHDQTLLDLARPGTQQCGSCEFELPRESMHSFDSGNNKIIWQIVVEGDIPRYPDIKNSYPITVRPLPLS